MAWATGHAEREEPVSVERERQEVVYSGVEDNWMRVEITHSIAHNYYQNRCRLEEEYGCMYPESELFCVKAYDEGQKERRFVEMVIAWSAVTLESLVNHVIAEVYNDNAAYAIAAIENPKKITRKIHKINNGNIQSDLADKIYILNERVNDTLRKADKISNMRNIVIHDKPYDCWGDGFEVFSSKNFSIPHYNYDDLQDFYEDCDIVKESILYKRDADIGRKISFSSLLRVPTGANAARKVE
jgi:hypothetical protein